MTTPPPPPGPVWPTSQQPQPPPQSWWTGGRVTIAVVGVVLLMGGAGVVGFFIGLAVGGTSEFADDLMVDEFATGSSDVFPGVTDVDTPAAEGADLEPGGRVNGIIGDRPVEHTLELPNGGDVELEITDARFDTVLVVLDADRDVVASDDDGGEGVLSRLSTTLPPGTYTVRVEPWSGSGTGGYTLVAR